jgi:hypothetical protein
MDLDTFWLECCYGNDQKLLPASADVQQTTRIHQGANNSRNCYGSLGIDVAYCMSTPVCELAPLGKCGKQFSYCNIWT